MAFSPAMETGFIPDEALTSPLIQEKEKFPNFEAVSQNEKEIVRIEKRMKVLNRKLVDFTLKEETAKLCNAGFDEFVNVSSTSLHTIRYWQKLGNSFEDIYSHINVQLAQDSKTPGVNYDELALAARIIQAGYEGTRLNKKDLLYVRALTLTLGQEDAMTYIRNKREESEIALKQEYFKNEQKFQEMSESSMEVGFGDVNPALKRLVGIPENERALLVQHVTSRDAADNIQRIGFINSSHRGTLSTADDLEFSEKITGLYTYNHGNESSVITFCLPVKYLKRDPYYKGLWFDNKLAEDADPNLKERYDNTPAYYNAGNIKPVIMANEVPGHYPVYIPKEYIVGVMNLARGASLNRTYERFSHMVFENEEDCYGIDLEKLNECLNKNSKGADFIAALSTSPTIEVVLDSAVGVAESYSLREHTGLVFNQFERLYESSYSSNLLSPAEFKLMLALHDLGKPVAIQEALTASEQHIYTQKMAGTILSNLDMPPEKVALVLSLLSGDIMGNYVKGKANPIEFASQVHNIAKSLGVNSEEYFNLLEMYYMCDASSYTRYSGGQRSLEKLFNSDEDSLELKTKNKARVALAKQSLKVFNILSSEQDNT